MKSINVTGTARTATGKKATREIRKSGAVPCNLYGEAKGENGLPKAFSFSATQEELRKLVYSPDIYSVNLNIDGKECKAIMKELQFHPVTDKLLHIDFYEINETKPIVMEELGDATVTIGELYDALADKLPEGFTKGKLQYAITRLWAEDFVRVEGKTNGYRKA